MQRELCKTDVETYAQRYLALSELDSANRCSGDMSCLLRKITIHRTLRDYNDYQSFLLWRYATSVEKSARGLKTRSLANAFALLKYDADQARWCVANTPIDGDEDGADTVLVVAEVWVHGEHMHADEDDSRRAFHTVLMVRERAQSTVLVIPFGPEGGKLLSRYAFPFASLFGSDLVPIMDTGRAPYAALLWVHTACFTGATVTASYTEDRGTTGANLFELHLADALLPRDLEMDQFRKHLDATHGAERLEMVGRYMQEYRIFPSVSHGAEWRSRHL